MTRLRRIDLAVEGEELAPPVQLPNGNWVLEGYATRAGVFRYLNPDGTERFEYRDPEVVKAAVDNLALCILTNEHPREGYVTPDNAEKHCRGFVLESSWEEATQRVKVRCIASHRDLLDALRAGKRQLSAGYEASVVLRAGEWKGQRYTHAQEDLAHNHLAVVEAGRAGPDCGFRLDSDGHMVPIDVPPIPVPSIDTPPLVPSNVGAGTPPPPAEKELKDMEKITINGKTFEVPPEVAAAYNAEKAAREAELAKLREQTGTANSTAEANRTALLAAQADVTKKDGEVTELKKQLDTMKVTLDSEKAEVKRLEKLHSDAASPEAIRAQVTKRAELERKVQPVLGENYEYAKADDVKLRADALDKLLAEKPELKAQAEAYAKDKNQHALLGVLFDAEIARFKHTDNTLGGTHGPAKQPTNVDGILAKKDKELAEKYRGEQAKK